MVAAQLENKSDEPCNVPGLCEGLWWPVVELLCLSSRAWSSVSRTPLWIITVQCGDPAPSPLSSTTPLIQNGVFIKGLEREGVYVVG